ncbi:PREDICTED: uncharacterized protein LOC109587522 [Amphimedon queenslandica]|uniref:Uncharacterized protein n=1 Tax=Amphimedon queenslandica TaxID=400682 RepID=A0AAN0JR57_AMPQE|nr:PREDICTED: uncharacterized protein LOC109587522 [Amphimedon queenslandica]|eukprot:XP_019859325.1 PREDICTED: uncharacterized protein LOC109587522 [Amphimedon queenslandica]
MAGNILPTVQANQLGLEPREEPNIILYGPPDDWGHQKEKGFTEIDILSSLLTGPQAKEIVLFKEENFTFDIALATARNNSWEGIHHGGFHKFEEKKLKSIDLCSKIGKQQRMSEIEIMSRMADMLKTPAPPSEAKKAGQVVWYQYPYREKEGPSPKEAMNNVKDWQERGDYLLLGIVSTSTMLSFKIRIDQHFTDYINQEYPNYSFLGVDKKFVDKLVSYGYCNVECKSSDDQEQSKFDKHLTLVFQKK